MKKPLLVILSFFMVIMLFQACAKPQETLQRIYKGDSEFDPSIVANLSIQEVIESADQYTGSFVSVTGKITTICSVGCWFYIQDEAGNEMYVNLKPQNFDVPQSSVGKNVIVTGILEAGEGNYRISAFQIEFTDIKE
ncbi:MAG: DUF4920 domain-containing protein [Caldisericia bacterium]|nr:DUF4920 domain-containing protein [Caldisericia bacterium]